MLSFIYFLNQRKIRIQNYENDIPTVDGSEKLLNFLTLAFLIVFVGTLSLLNFSLAYLIVLLYVPVSLLAIQHINSR
jgi:hypothetical protein